MKCKKNIETHGIGRCFWYFYFCDDPLTGFCCVLLLHHLIWSVPVPLLYFLIRIPSEIFWIGSETRYGRLRKNVTFSRPGPLRPRGPRVSADWTALRSQHARVWTQIHQQSSYGLFQAKDLIWSKSKIYDGLWKYEERVYYILHRNVCVTDRLPLNQP